MIRIQFLVAVLLVQFQCFAQTGKVERVVVTSVGLKSNLLGDSNKRPVSIYLPPGYVENTDTRYPVLYLLHGYSGTDRLWFGENYVKGLDLKRIADSLILHGTVKPMIIVAPNCKNRYGGSWYTNSEATGDWEDFVAEELVTYIDEHYRTIDSLEGRGIAGHSMGGHGALKIAMRRPDVFSSVYGMSPAWLVFDEIWKAPWIKRIEDAAKVVDERNEEKYKSLHWRSKATMALGAAVSPSTESTPFHLLLPEGPDANDEVWKAWLSHDPSRMVEKTREDLKAMKGVAIDVGLNEDLLDMNRVFVAELQRNQIPFLYEEFDGDHTNRVGNQLRKSVLPFFSSLLASPYQSSSLNSNGTEISYQVAGTGSPVVLIHGLTGNAHDFAELRERLLSEGFRVILFDVRGHGNSGKPTEKNQYGRQMIDDICNLLDHLQIGKSHVVGYSMGGDIANKFRELHPELLNRCVVGGAGLGVTVGWAEQAHNFDDIAKALKNDKGFLPLLRLPGAITPGKASDELIGEVNTMMLANQNEDALAALLESYEELDLKTDKLLENSVPTLVVVGSKDAEYKSSIVLNEKLSNSSLTVIQGLNHFEAWQSRQFADAVVGFLSKDAQR